jgi:hypothetical protein
LKNTSLTDNSASYQGGGVFAYGNQATCSVENTTCSENEAVAAGGGFFLAGGIDVFARNSIFWANEADRGPEFAALNFHDFSLQLNYSDIDTSATDWIHVPEFSPRRKWGSGNISENPRLVKIDGFRILLDPRSPCIDAGDPDPAWNDIEDPGRPGFALAPARGSIRNDMGANGGNSVKVPQPFSSLQMSPAMVDFGYAGWNEKRELCLQVTNQDLDPVNIVAIDFLGSQMFSVPGMSKIRRGGFVIGAGETRTLRVRYTGDARETNPQIASMVIRTDDSRFCMVKCRVYPLAGTFIDDNSAAGVWDTEHHPYNVSCDLSVPRGERLIFEPGVQVRFLGPYMLRIGAESRLIARGSVTDSIRFTAIDTVTGWQGIRLIQSGTDDTLSHCVIEFARSGDKINGYGGGLYISDASPYLERSTLRNNRALRGGAIYWDHADAELSRMTVSRNAAQWGGGLYFNDCNVVLENSRIDDNSAEYGGGMLCGGSRSSIVNVTLTGNTAESFSGAISLVGRNRLECRNSILWDNRSPYGSSLGISHADTVYFYYSDIDTTDRRWINWSYPECGALFWREGNISADPLFRDSLGVAYTLGRKSPCIDRGDPRPFFYDAENRELPGIALWPAGGTCRNDMGAYGGGVRLLSALHLEETPSVFFLRQNYPNPFNRRTTIEYDIPEPGFVRIAIYNVRGRLVKKVVDAEIPAGRYKAVWNGDNSRGQPVASGLYFCRMNADEFVMWKKMILAK